MLKNRFEHIEVPAPFELQTRKDIYLCFKNRSLGVSTDFSPETLLHNSRNDAMSDNETKGQDARRQN